MRMTAGNGLTTPALMVNGSGRQRLRGQRHAVGVSRVVMPLVKGRAGEVSAQQVEQAKRLVLERAGRVAPVRGSAGK